MVSGNKAGLFNLTLAALAGGASAFAIFAMPQELMAGGIEGIGLEGLIASPIDRQGVMTAAAICASLLAWVALRSCDPPRVKPAALTDDDLDEDWLTQRLAGRSGPVDPPARQPLHVQQDLGLDNPFAELARGAEPIEGPLELRKEQIADEPAVAANDDDECLRTTELLARMQPPAPEAGVADLIQQLNAGLVDGEWPLPSGEHEDAPEVDRLRSVLRDLQGRPRGV